MWTLFTKALARGNSTTQVQVVNTSSNFVLTALLGFAVFAESLPPLWWVGAALLVAGTVIVGRKDEAAAASGDGAAGDEAAAPGDGLEVEAEPLIRVSSSPNAARGRAVEKRAGGDAVEEDEDVLDLDVDAVASGSSSSSVLLVER